MATLIKPPIFGRSQLLNLYVPREGDGCVLWLPGQDDPQSSTIRDRSGNGNDGTITGATWTRQSKGLWALYFDGTDDYADCGAPSVLDFGSATDFSIEFWLKTNYDATQYRGLVSKRPDYGTSDGFAVGMTATEKINFYIADGTNYVDVSSDTSVKDDTWHQVVVTADRDGNAQHYLDGATDGTATSITSVGDITSADNLIIGALTSTGRFCQGNVALLRIYNRLLSSLEIQNHFNQERHLFGV